MNEKNFVPPAAETDVEPSTRISRKTENALAVAVLVLLLSLIIIFALAVTRIDAQGQGPRPGPYNPRPRNERPVRPVRVTPRAWHCDSYAPMSYCPANATPRPGGLGATPTPRPGME